MCFSHISPAQKKCGGNPPVGALIKWFLLGSLMSQGMMRLATPCPLLVRPHGGCGGGWRGLGEGGGGVDAKAAVQSSSCCGTGTHGVRTAQKTVEIPAVVPVLFSDNFQQSRSLN